ncbi:hypothetical protein VT84_06260 [Gemmata sp. SH-PL17]|uniref:hypothetical protein n=1 Tax=Gemmata sp. SH-PL17 TaxID=1630693 RepID=UPI00078DBC06|nr:hypothetical protein [Gemmata sp. SH-PL17]AMV23979.1 hypothetical protein VT84_06260 [Gemmata sp. SH-PL17]
MASFDIVLRTQGSLHPGGSPTEFVSEYAGLIRCTDDETGVVTNVGRVAARRVHAERACDAGEWLYDVCDAHSAELHDLHGFVYEPDGYDFKAPLVRRFETTGCDLLVLDYVILSPKWRGLRLGLLAVRKLVDLIGGGCGFVVSEIAPLSAEGYEALRVPAAWLPPLPSDEAIRDATVRLRRYYRRMGFRRLGRTRYYALPLNQVTPTAHDLLRPT